MPVCFTPVVWRRATFASIVVVSMTVLAACASDGVGTSTASAPAASPFLGAARAIGVATTEPEPQEFVRNSRPATGLDFIPVGHTPPARAEPKRDTATLEKLEQELDGQRSRSRTYAARPKPTSTYDGKVPPRLKVMPVTPSVD